MNNKFLFKLVELLIGSGVFLYWDFWFCEVFVLEDLVFWGVFILILDFRFNFLLSDFCSDCVEFVMFIFVFLGFFFLVSFLFDFIFGVNG